MQSFCGQAVILLLTVVQSSVFARNFDLVNVSLHLCSLPQESFRASTSAWISLASWLCSSCFDARWPSRAKNIYERRRTATKARSPPAAVCLPFIAVFILIDADGSSYKRNSANHHDIKSPIKSARPGSSTWSKNLLYNKKTDSHSSLTPRFVEPSTADASEDSRSAIHTPYEHSAANSPDISQAEPMSEGTALMLLR